MGFVVQAESHTLELSAVYQFEYDHDIYEYYDQPEPIKLTFETNGKKTATLHTPDFLVLRKTGVGWVECKTEDALRERAKISTRFLEEPGKGVWRCPPGEAEARSFEFFYEIVTPKQISHNLVRNLKFLEDFLDPGAPGVPTETEEVIKSIVKGSPGITLTALLNDHSNVRPADVYGLLGKHRLFCNLSKGLLSSSEEPVRLFPDAEVAKGYQFVEAAQKAEELEFPLVRVGTGLLWRGHNYSVAALDPDAVVLNCGGFTNTLDLRVFNQHVQNGDIRLLSQVPVAPTPHPIVEQLLKEASPKDQERANSRYLIVSSPELPPNCKISKRTLSRLRGKVRNAEALYGNGYVGLLPQWSKCGNRSSRLAPDTVTLVDEAIKEHYCTATQKNKSNAYQALVKMCEAKRLHAPSYKFFIRRLKARTAFDLALARKGRRGAYEFEPPALSPGEKNPNHGDRPWEIAHIDHTQCDIETTYGPESTHRRRPWITVMFDAYSRKVLAFALSYSAPSYRCCMTVIRECVRRHNRLPSNLVVDGGKEFQGNYFETLLAKFCVCKKTRPPAKARFGTLIERFFGTLNTEFFYNLEGNTQLMKNVRQVTAAFNPKRNTRWTLPDLETLLRAYAYRVYEGKTHPDLHVPIAEAYVQGVKRSGDRQCRLIPYNETFKLATLPSTSSGNARIRRNRIQVHYIRYYSHEMKGLSENVPVRYDPWDVGTCYAFIKGRWVKCISEHFKVFHNRSEMEMRIASMKLRELHRDRRRGANLYGKRLAEFILSNEGIEVLRNQRLCDDAERPTDSKDHRIVEAGNRDSEVKVEDDARFETLPAPEEDQFDSDDIIPFADL